MVNAIAAPNKPEKTRGYYHPLKTSSSKPQVFGLLPTLYIAKAIPFQTLQQEITMAMSSTSKAWIVAASIGAVEALKDQMGFCRWNYVLRSTHHYAKTNVRSVSQAKSLAPSSAAVVSGKLKEAQQSEESLRKVMYLSCWGPY
ncbi:unnamed protein product [Linum tenue]|uniref:Wound-responsive family protein n=1 Tax=Linum tenue TaxID=586396 RepID=A0AAV0JPH3_9ROSI|nr:unnamed protein product [Linum tenue]